MLFALKPLLNALNMNPLHRPNTLASGDNRIVRLVLTQTNSANGLLNLESIHVFVLDCIVLLHVRSQLWNLIMPDKVKITIPDVGVVVIKMCHYIALLAL
jgi:hypothetical protein